MFYDSLDAMRNDMLSQEYSMRAKMDTFEQKSKSMVHKMHTYSLIEFFHEERNLANQIDALKLGLDDFNIYLP